MDYVKCDCGCEVFYQVPTLKVNIDGFNVYNGASIKADVNTASILICIQCNRAVMPTTSWPGRNRMDPEVEAHQQVYNAVQNRNGVITNVEASRFDRLASNRIVG
jgi:hypothetical protein